jgi:hypothetical protein
MRVSRTFTLATVLGLALCVGASSGASADPAPVQPETYASGNGALVTDAAGNALVVGGRAIDDAHVNYRYRHVGGHWSALTGISSLGGTYLAAAAGEVNMPLVVAHLNGSDRAGVMAVIRRTNGSWTPPVRLDAGLGGYPSGVAAAGNAGGDHAVSWTMTTGPHARSTYTAIRHLGGSWHTFLVGGLSDISFSGGVQPTTRVGIDSSGNVTVARTVTSGGSATHRLLTRRKPINGAWQSQLQVSGATRSVRWSDLVIEPTGRESIAYQLVNDTSDTYGDSYLLHQGSVDSALGQVWHQPAASTPSIAAAGGRLRVVWATETGTDPAVAHTQGFNPAAGPVQDLSGEPAGLTGVAVDKYGVGVVATASTDPTDNDAVVRPVTANGLGAGQSLAPVGDQNEALLPALGAGSDYFVGVEAIQYAGLGDDFSYDIGVFRLSRS